MPTLRLSAIAKNYDHVVIDGPPRVSDLARSAIIAADLVLIPVQPSPYDVWAAQEIVNLVNEASVYKENLKSVLLKPLLYKMSRLKLVDVLIIAHS